jgi:hypothetical protein
VGPSMSRAGSLRGPEGGPHGATGCRGGRTASPRARLRHLRKHEFALEALTQAVARLRRSAMALRDENAELRAELSRLQQLGAAPR